MLGLLLFSHETLTPQTSFIFSICKMKKAGTITEGGCHNGLHEINRLAQPLLKRAFPVASKRKKEDVFGRIASVL